VLMRNQSKVTCNVEELLINIWLRCQENRCRGVPRRNVSPMTSDSPNFLCGCDYFSVYNSQIRGIMATQSSFPALLETLTQALTSASESTQKLSAPIPPQDGISLLDVKNELFLSYLQNLVFLVVLKIRNRKNGASDDDEEQDLDNSVVKKLVELQIYLEKGVRPLEDA